MKDAPAASGACNRESCFQWGRLPLEPELVWKNSDSWSPAACPEGLPLPGGHRALASSTDLVEKVGQDKVGVREGGGLNHTSCVWSACYVPGPELSAINIPSHFTDMETETDFE